MGIVVSLPNTDDVVAFVFFFFPGYITVWLASTLCGVNIKERSDLEKIVLSSIFSITSFLLAGVSPRPEDIFAAVFDIHRIPYVFLASIGTAVTLWLAIWLWKWVDDFVVSKSQRFWSRLGRTHRTPRSCSSYVLRQLYDARLKNELVVYTTSGDVYKGSFEGYTPEPLEIILMGRKDRIEKRKEGEWVEIPEYLMCFNDRDIRRISAIGIVGD